MQYKKAAMYMLFFALLVMMTGCGKKEIVVDHKDVVYESKAIVPDATIEGLVTSFTVWNDRIFVYVAPWETPDYDDDGNATVGERKIYGKCYSMELDGSDTKELTLPKVNGEI